MKRLLCHAQMILFQVLLPVLFVLAGIGIANMIGSTESVSAESPSLLLSAATFVGAVATPYDIDVPEGSPYTNFAKSIRVCLMIYCAGVRILFTFKRHK